VNVYVDEATLEPHAFLAITFHECPVDDVNVDGVYELVNTFAVGLPGNVVPIYTS